MKIYTGHKTRSIRPYVVVMEEGKDRPLPVYDPGNHSPDGFNWGYAGSGPACLASSLLKDATGCNCQWAKYKYEMIAKLPDTWQMSESDIIQLAIIIRRRDGHESTCVHHPLYKKEPKGD